MAPEGAPIDETGTLLREGGGFVLRRDQGGTFTLELRRTPVDLVEKRVRITGWETRPGHVDVDGIRSYRF
ncbi:DUF5818 domain-containing protein [Sphingomonas sp. YR710]|uniref:DUF5818 domain-containing protein n=1 Tax=Sphingomonas sp. YR710 TaxID=1882773 RepID=UPI000A913E34|nr:DUF5818 domain-containing protein [Sphingomonas sp. YR710]